MKPFILAVLVFAVVSVGGCSGLKKITGQTNDNVLPGNREQIIPEDQKTARDPIVQGNGQAETDAPAAPSVPCDPKKKICPPEPVTVQ